MKARARQTRENIELVKEPASFFQEKLAKALDNQKVPANPEIESYLVNLLSRFVISENLFVCKEDGNLRSETLALLMAQATSSDDEAEKKRGLQRLGDVSLYTAGFFADSLARKVVDVDYYIGMGRSAYGSLASVSSQRPLQALFRDLASRFAQFVEVLGEVSAEALAMPSSDQNILRLYELWLKTQSPRAESNLKKAGIIPNRALKPTKQ